MGLKEYQRKRKFDQTPEPKGKKGKAKGDLKFVVQMHDASRLHFDLRLEWDGVFKSWAVPKGPSLNPSDQRLAVRVEDHPLEYGDFEGIIPEKNYGAGTVVVWDNGTFVERTSKGRADSEKALQEGYEKGHITFILNGTKLRGEFALIKLKRGDAKTWLLVKKRDAYASYRGPAPDNNSVISGRSLEEVKAHAEKKGIQWLPKRQDRHKPVEKKAARKSSPSPASLPRRVRPTLPIAGGAPSGKEWVFDAFGEGTRAIATVEDGKAALHSRFLMAITPQHPALISALGKISHDLVMDGEIVGEGKKEVFRALDLLFVDGEDLTALSLEQRLKRLKALKLKSPLEITAPTKSAPEGAWIARNLETPYKQGTSRDWVKSSARAARVARTPAPTRPNAKAPRERSKPAVTPRAIPDGPHLTNLDKIYWPDEGYTKGDLIAYYQSVAPFILPHLIDRPQSLHRYPNGIKKEGFFQKDVSGHVPRWLKTVRVFSAGSDRTINYALCQDEKSLLYLANLGCIELNAWLSRVPELEVPDTCVIDLDPDDNSFNEVVEVALEVHAILEKLRIPHGVKTSGATGMHIYIPLTGKCDFDDSKDAAFAVVEQVHKKFPKNTSLERSPSKRRHRIYLDFLQNRRSQTMAAAYCVRPHPGATVSTPLHWKEVKKGLDPQQFTIETVPPRLKKQGDPWRSLAKAGIPMAHLKRQLARLK